MHSSDGEGNHSTSLAYEFSPLDSIGDPGGILLLCSIHARVSNGLQGFSGPSRFESSHNGLCVCRILLAGPLIITVTCLSLIFTIGLGDNQDRDGLSAYAVFNRGFDRLLGSVDVDALVAQHVGGGMAPGFGGDGRLPPHDDDDGDQHRAQGRHQQQRNNNNDENGDRPNVRNRARKSGKKERRRDLAQRREINDQR